MLVAVENVANNEKHGHTQDRVDHDHDRKQVDKRGEYRIVGSASLDDRSHYHVLFLQIAQHLTELCV